MNYRNATSSNGQILSFTSMLCLLAGFTTNAHARFQVSTLREDFPEASAPSNWSADFDGDGRQDLVSVRIGDQSDPAMPGGVNLLLSSTGTTQHFGFGNPSDRIHDLDVELVYLDQENRWPSLLVAYTFSQGLHTDSHPQKIIFNQRGTLSIQDVGLNLAGRSVRCNSWGSRSVTYCFWADYQSKSKLVRMDSSGTAVDVTAEAGLPFPLPPSIERTHGRYMIGVGFLDFDGDGFDDYVSVGQHAFVNVGHYLGIDSVSPSFSVGYIEEPGEYMRVYVPSRRLDPSYTGHLPPCIYLAMEKSESPRPDYLKCYDQIARQWYDVALPGTFYMEYSPVRFWDQDDNGDIDFLAQNDHGHWVLMTLRDF